MKVETFVPEIVQARDREKPWADWLCGSVLFADISGFTPMSEALGVLGAEGAEILTDILNRYFARMIGILDEHGGQVMKFGGDAILCFFPEQDSPQRTQRAQRQGKDAGDRRPDAGLRKAIGASRQMQQAMSRFQRIKTPVKTFALKMKIGVAEGKVLLAGVGDPAVRCDFAFAGKPVDLSSKAEHHAKAGEIILAAAKAPSGVNARSIEKGFWRLSSIPQFPNPQSAIRNPLVRNPQSAMVEPYLIQEVHEMVKAGYHRYMGALQPMVPVFLQFSGFSYSARSFDLQRFHEFFSLVMRVTHQYEGRLNRISMGDKGSTMLVLFGAPKEIEKKEELACRWALEVRDQAQKEFPEVRLRIGMTSGRVFSGIVGASGRFEYTVMGDVVNLAARLMQGSKQNQICCCRDLETGAEKGYRFASLGSRVVKGKAAPVPVFALKEPTKPAEFLADKQDFIGRTAEIAVITDHLKSAGSGSPRMVLVEGDAGVGKSFLANRILSQARADRWSIVTCRSEAGGHGRSYAPWHQVFDTVFFHGKKPGMEFIRELLQSVDESFLQYLPWHLEYFRLRIADCGLDPKSGMRTGKQTPNKQDTKELSRYDEESRKNLLHHQLSTVLLRMFGGDPTLFYLDDLHWFDSLSLDLLLAFLNHLKDQPVLLLATTRPNWQKEKFVDRSICHYFQLKEMDRGDVKEMAAKLLGADVRDALVDFLYERTHGNPFFTRQLLDYLKANDLLQSRLGEWNVSRNAEVKGGLSGEEVIIAQAEHLKPQEQIHLRAAACIGPTFHFPVFERAMGKNFGPNTFLSLFSHGYFQEIGPGEFSFPHALVQETLYHAMPKRLRKKNHRAIASALESIFADNLELHYPALATHYYEAGVRSKAGEYSLAAGNRLYENLSYPEACRFLQRSYDLLTRTRATTRLDVGIRLGRALVRTGRVQEALRIARRLLRLTRKRRSRDAYYMARALELEAMRRLGDYGYMRSVRRALRQPMRIPTAIRGQLMYSLGLAYHSGGKLDEAAKYFKMLLQREPVESNPQVVFSSYVRLAGINSVRGDFKEALSLLSKASELAEKRNNPYQALRINMERANILVESGKLENARALYLKLLETAEKVGDSYLTAMILENLGYVESSTGRWKTAGKYLVESIKLFSAIGVLNGHAQALLYMGILAFYESRFKDAYQHYLDSVQIFERTNEMVHACHGYYNLAEVSAKLGRTREAREWHEKGIRSFKAEDDPKLAQMYRDLGELLAGNQGDTEARR